MHTKTLLYSLLLLASPTIMANPVYQPETQNTTHYEATAGSIGLIAGSLVAGPFGAIIGGSLGVFAGHQQTQTETITEQRHFITELEQDLTVINQALAQLELQIVQLESSQQHSENEFHQSQQAYDDKIKQFLTSYQFDVYFLSNSAIVPPHVQQGLLKLANLLNNYPEIEARVEAHSDWRGSDDANFQLAQARLDSITGYLSLNGVKNSQLLATNYGENKNMNNGSWGEYLFYDRRVTITLNHFGR